MRPSTAIQISNKLAITLKNKVGVCVFNNFIGETISKDPDVEKKTYDDFLLDNKGDMFKASEEWSEYKEELNQDGSSTS